MNGHKKATRIVGALFITATVTSVIGHLVILSPILDASDYLSNIAANDMQTVLGILLDAINAFVVVAIPVLLYPILKKHNEALALGYLASRIMESVILFIGHISLLALVTISREYTQAASEAAYIQTVGNSLVAVSDWAFLLGPGIVFSLTALILNTILYQAKLVPRFISIWGFIGAILLFMADMLGIFGLSTTSTLFTLLVLPIGLQEMVFAGWLIVKGFNPSAMATESAKTDQRKTVRIAKA